MKRFNFGTFVVDESSREAFDVCQTVADLGQIDKLPVLLVGDEGCGKTHLLYSIVNRVRAGSTRTGLAYVTAYDFPDQVRALIDDPSPVQRAKSAVLLVDQVEKFRDLVEELEAVVRIFLDCGQIVVLASSWHPVRLQNLTPGLRALLEAGRIVHVRPPSSTTQLELVKQQVREELDGEVRARDEEIVRLRAQLEQGGMDVGFEELEDLRQALETQRAENAELTRRIEEARHAGESQPVRQLQERLAVAEREGREARNEANGLLQRAQGLLEQIEANQTKFKEAEATHQRQIRELEERLALRETGSTSAEQLAQDRDRIQELEHETEQVRKSFELRLIETERACQDEIRRAEVQLENVRAQYMQAEKERETLERSLDGAQANCVDLEAQLSESRQAAVQTAERAVEAQRLEAEADKQQALDALRQEAEASKLQALEAQQHEAGVDMQLALEVMRRKAEAGKQQALEALRQEGEAQAAISKARVDEAEAGRAQAQAALDRSSKTCQSIQGELFSLVDQLAVAGQTATSRTVALARAAASEPDAEPEDVDEKPHGEPPAAACDEQVIEPEPEPSPPASFEFDQGNPLDRETENPDEAEPFADWSAGLSSDDSSDDPAPNLDQGDLLI